MHSSMIFNRSIIRNFLSSNNVTEVLHMLPHADHPQKMQFFAACQSFLLANVGRHGLGQQVHQFELGHGWLLCIVRLITCGLKYDCVLHLRVILLHLLKFLGRSLHGHIALLLCQIVVLIVEVHLGLHCNIIN